MTVLGRRMSRRVFRENLTAWLFVSPLLLGFLGFILGPLMISAYIGFTKYSLFSPPEWIGLENFRQALGGDANFVRTLSNSGTFALGVIPIAIGGGLVLALILNRRLPGVPFARAIAYLPVVSTWAAIGLAWRLMYNVEFGLINYLLSLFGIGEVPWLGSTRTAMPAVIIVHGWKGMGFPMVLYLAALQGIPDEYYEAARIDGANRWHMIWRITFPLLTPVTFFLVTMGFINSLQAFDSIRIMTNGGPAGATEVIVFKIWQTAFSFLQFGYASAMSWILFAAIFAITFFQWRLRKRWVFME